MYTKTYNTWQWYWIWKETNKCICTWKLHYACKAILYKKNCWCKLC